MLFSFADRTLDVERRELRHGAEPVGVEPQVFDVLLYLIQLSSALGLDPVQLAQAKIAVNEGKYPVDQSRGNATKYNER